jgi:Trk K+ transport system NAD-binding subunit
MLSLTIVAITAYVVADLLKSPPIYEALLGNLIMKDDIREENEHNKKVIIEMVVQHGSLMENSQVKMIKWPRKSLLVSVKRGETEILPKGDTELKAGDYLFVLTDINSESKTREKLGEINANSID